MKEQHVLFREPASHFNPKTANKSHTPNFETNESSNKTLMLYIQLILQGGGRLEFEKGPVQS